MRVKSLRFDQWHFHFRNRMSEAKTLGDSLIRGYIPMRQPGTALLKCLNAMLWLKSIHRIPVHIQTLSVVT